MLSQMVLLSLRGLVVLIVLAHSSEIFSIAAAPSRVITASGDPVIKIWDPKSEHPLIHKLDDAHPLGVHHLAVDIDNGGTTIASAGFEHGLVMWDLQEGKERVRLKPEGISFQLFSDVSVD